MTPAIARVSTPKYTTLSTPAAAPTHDSATAAAVPLPMTALRSARVRRDGSASMSRDAVEGSTPDAATPSADDPFDADDRRSRVVPNAAATSAPASVAALALTRPESSTTAPTTLVSRISTPTVIPHALPTRPSNRCGDGASGPRPEAAPRRRDPDETARDRSARRV